ncbi:MAG: DUF4922 domain-containing protein [Nodosilinea sp.]
MVYPLESPLAPGLLWDKIQQQTRHALACEALQPIATEHEFIEQGGMRFLVRILANLARKQSASQAQAAQSKVGKAVNPFLPYDDDLFVANLSPTHLCLLNKYNVVDHHILIVTRTFEDQDTWLTLADFEALTLAMADIDGLAFYNGGRLAGASQAHKHLQLMPPPLCPDGGPLPLAQVVEALGFKVDFGPGDLPSSQPIAYNPAFPFRHAIASLPAGWLASSSAAATLLTAYHALLTHLGIDIARSPQDFPYNLLIMRGWIMAVRRRQEDYQSIPVNSLGFAGSLLVKNQEQLDLLKAIGPMTILKNVAA